MLVQLGGVIAGEGTARALETGRHLGVWGDAMGCVCLGEDRDLYGQTEGQLKGL